MSKILTVFGATGNQGGSVVHHVLSHPELSKTYKVRAITRDPSKPKAQALKARGCEVVAADMNDAESLKKAIAGSGVVFGVTNYWEAMDMQLEIRQGKAIADASKAAGVERLIWSSLPNVTKETKGAITAVEHFDSKAQVEQYIRDIQQPATFFMPAMFMSVGLSNFRKLPDDKYYFTTPFNRDTKVPLYNPGEDTGTFVAAILLLGDETLNKRVLGSAPYITPEQMVKDFNDATGLSAEFMQISWDQFKAALPPAAAEELTGNFKLVVDFDYYVGEPADGVEKSIDLVKRAGLKPPMTWGEYVKKNWKTD
ncbi:uncharacterized protein PV09_05904 [Verruconis gallopava]|uniref:NmrA-like family domain-containing protein 1 n=1 Tax=Verruconis gallopava TaxID=253628 RepID=A0A0D2AUM3_9PEZI|nr:uncharacterized protein PV09_05904 [Verruconis gallopava]KIW02849.1 hypothetical protein PV09_05904 [Verruconis gallopava]